MMECNIEMARAHQVSVVNAPRAYRTARDINPLLECIRVAYTGRAMKSAIASFGLRYPVRITDMYLGSEPAEYILAAVVAVNQAGE